MKSKERVTITIVCDAKLKRDLARVAKDNGRTSSVQGARFIQAGIDGHFTDDVSDPFELVEQVHLDHAQTHKVVIDETDLTTSKVKKK